MANDLLGNLWWIRNNKIAKLADEQKKEELMQEEKNLENAFAEFIKKIDDSESEQNLPSAEELMNQYSKFTDKLKELKINFQRDANKTCTKWAQKLAIRSNSKFPYHVPLENEDIQSGCVGCISMDINQNYCNRILAFSLSHVMNLETLKNKCPNNWKKFIVLNTSGEQRSYSLRTIPANELEECQNKQCPALLENYCLRLIAELRRNFFATAKIINLDSDLENNATARAVGEKGIGILPLQNLIKNGSLDKKLDGTFDSSETADRDKYIREN